MNFKNKIFLLTAVFLTVGIFSYRWYISRPVPFVASENQGVLVEAVRAKTGTITRRVTTNGTLVPVQSVTLMPEVEGKIASIPFKQGAEVPKGSVLLKIDDAIYRIQVEEAKAKVELARSKYQRADYLLKKDFGTAAARDEALAQLRVNEAELAAAQLRFSQTEILAPFDGFAGLKNVSIGTFVAKNQELLYFVRLEPIYVDFSVPESYGKNLSTGQEIDAVVEGFDSLPFTGGIIAIDPKADQMTHSIQVRAELPNESSSLKPGEFVRVSLELGQEEGVVLIPRVAVERDGEQEFVYLVIDGVAVRTEVTTGQKEAELVQILDGVKEGDQVVTVGQLKLQDGYPVRIVGENAGEPQGKKSPLSRPPLKIKPDSSKTANPSGQGH